MDTITFSVRISYVPDVLEIAYVALLFMDIGYFFSEKSVSVS